VFLIRMTAMIDNSVKITNKKKLENLAEKINNMLSEMGFNYTCHTYKRSFYYNDLSFTHKDLYYKYWLLRVSDHLPSQNEDRRERDFNLYYSKTPESFYVEEAELDSFKEEIIGERDEIIYELDKLIELKKNDYKSYKKTEDEIFRNYGVVRNRINR